MLPKAIFLMGNRGAGKGTIAMYLAEHYCFQSRGFADPLYEQLTILNPLIQTGTSLTTPKNYYYNDLVAEYGVDYVKRNFPEVRRYLQLLGTECGRKVHGQQCWINIAAERSKGDFRSVFFDTRFDNERDWGRSLDSVFIHVTSPKEEPVGEHVSEYSLDYTENADYTIRNDGTLQQLYDKVETLLDNYAMGMNA